MPQKPGTDGSVHAALKDALGPMPDQGAEPQPQGSGLFTNSRIPYALNSRPYPDRFTPPKGRRGSEATIPLMNTIRRGIS
jgi:hypothetical protein